MKATIIYKTDHQHTYASHDFIGVFTNKRELLRAVKKMIKEDQWSNPCDFKTKEELQDHIDWNIDFFFEKGQTQGLFGFELVSEHVEMNTII